MAKIQDESLFVRRIVATILSPVMLIVQDDPNVKTKSYGEILKEIWTTDVFKRE